MKEARQDVLQGLNIPLDEPGEDGQSNGFKAFQRYALKMATGTGKTTVMAMLAAWSILNKINNRQDARFSDVAIFICPNVTIRDRLGELDPHLGEQSLYRTRDLVPAHLMERLRLGKVLITNWHVLEQKEMNSVGNDPARVVRRGIPQNMLVTKTIDGKKEKGVETKYFESDTALVRRVFGIQISNKKNFLIFNDEAHHAYRVKPEEEIDSEQLNMLPEDEQEDYVKKEATVWIEGLDRINKVCGINFCVDLTATPYYINRAGNEAGRPFPWVVSDFGLVDAIESGIVKIPQLPVSDSTGSTIPPYFHVWKWIIEEKLTPSKRVGNVGR